ncbi:MAG: acetyl-CoA carboxylase biotin carboxyl carrier protein [Acidobacteriia bacterium]|nr:acetyl-CoA carboxylase biotin carboxyl carrier protein [Terriglobia bacterium]
MTIEEIRELIQLVSDTGVAELEVQRGENRVRIRRAFSEEAHDISVPNQQPATKPASGPLGKPKASEISGRELVMVKSPIVGTFYESASPGSQPFVRVGETVQPGKVLCIIESMKLMNEIEAEIAGVVESKLVPNAQPVEYGEALFAIRPL